MPSFDYRIGARRQNLAVLKLCAWLVLLTSTTTTRADVTNLVSMADTYLNGSLANSNFGTEVGVKIGTSGSGATQRGLLMFNPAAAMPTGSVIRSVQLQVTVTSSANSTAVPNFGLYRVLAGWAENEATWTNRLQSQSWASPGGAAGTDYLSTASASIALPGLGNYAYNSTAVLVSDVQGWLDDPSSNHGWMIISDQEGTDFTARKIDSHEGTSPPTLQIDFLPPPQITSATYTNQSVRIQFTADAPFAYEVQYSEAIKNPDWKALTNITAKTASFDAIALDSVTNGPQRFYRLSRSSPIRAAE